ncbi:DnaB-like helicase C-terminal domain-containing protein [Lysinibacillus capsici]|uniref:DnaB-like helicase C-terminal domain-containing protein n=1 Tax=Lysinibacillus capsici TaxID=2115968 RepID=UPI000E209A88|nr:DnaB-like helicase C-terminal domain-containing protein [Lysinibacillus capsici]RDV27744.1 DNA helicase [Lysinibacillus capsici]
MSNNGTLLLSKILDDNDVQALVRHNIFPDHFKVDADRKAYEFIRQYAEQNRGQAPSYATVVEHVPDFFYVPQVSDSYEWLTRRLLNDAGQMEFIDLVQSGIQPLFDEHKNDVHTLIDKLQEKFDNIKYRTNVREKIGTDVKNDTLKFLDEFDRRKEGKSFKTWKSNFSNIGEYVSGNMYVFYAKSGRGKSVIASIEETLNMAIQGANVLIWSMEMPWFEVLVRLYVALSGRKGLTQVNVAGIDLSGGFNANDVRNGNMAYEFEIAFRAFLDTLNDEILGNIIVRGVDDDDFSNRTLRQLETDILQTQADVVIVDPFYYLDYEKNTSKTAGGDAAETSKRLRRLTGTLQVVTLAITQADEGKESKNEDGERELALPEREAVKKTKALLEDASMLIAIDTDYKQGRGLVGINKGRNGGEGEVVEILYVPQVGVVREMETGETTVEHFNF